MSYSYYLVQHINDDSLVVAEEPYGAKLVNFMLRKEKRKSSLVYVESTGLNVLNSIPYSVNFGRGKPWRIWQITGGLPNFIIHTLTMSCDIYKETK